MYLAVKAVCDRNSSTWQSLPAFADACTEFALHVANIQPLAQSQAVDATGLAADKDQLRRAMATDGVEIGNALYAYARKVKNNDLAAQADVTMSTFLQGRDTIAADKARNIHDPATANLAALASYGVTATKLTAFKASIDAYAASITKPREATTNLSTATAQLYAEFVAADAALQDEMDVLVQQFASANAAFVADYQNARIVVDSTGGGKKAPPTPAPAATTK